MNTSVTEEKLETINGPYAAYAEAAGTILVWAACLMRKENPTTIIPDYAAFRVVGPITDGSSTHHLDELNKAKARLCEAEKYLVQERYHDADEAIHAALASVTYRLKLANDYKRVQVTEPSQA